MGQRRTGESLEFSERLVNVLGKDNDRSRENEDIESWTKDKLSCSNGSRSGWPRPITVRVLSYDFTKLDLAPGRFFGRGQV
jgi:hypothetical protein